MRVALWPLRAGRIPHVISFLFDVVDLSIGLRSSSYFSQKAKTTMAYISADGSVDGSRSRSRNPFKLLTDLFLGLINGILLFFRTISTPPERLPEVSSCAIEWDRRAASREVVIY